MKLIIVERSKTATYLRLTEKFAGDRNVKVILERRLNGQRDAGSSTAREERRRLKKAFEGRDYIVIHVANEKMKK